MTEPMTFESLQSTATGLTHARDTRHGDGRREPAPETGGMGLYESSLGARRVNEAKMKQQKVGPYSDPSAAHEKANKLKSQGAKSIRIDKEGGKHWISFVANKSLSEATYLGRGKELAGYDGRMIDKRALATAAKLVPDKTTAANLGMAANHFAEKEARALKAKGVSPAHGSNPAKWYGKLQSLQLSGVGGALSAQKLKAFAVMYDSAVRWWMNESDSEHSNNLSESGGKFELVYQTGGHGGPYGGQREAKIAAERLLKGGKDKWIAIIKAGDVTNLKKAKPVALLTRKGWERGSSHLPNIPVSQQESAEPKVDKQGSGPFVAYWETDSPKTIHRHAYKTKKKAVEAAVKIGNASVMKNGIEVVDVQGGKVVNESTVPACVQRAMTEAKRKLSPKDEAKWRALGAKAFKRGLKAEPFMDRVVRDAVEAGSGEVGSSIPIFDAWSKGWHQANLAKTEELAEAKGGGGRDGTVKTFLMILRANITQADMAQEKRDRKHKIPPNIHAIGLMLGAAEKVEKAVKADLGSDDIRALDRLKAAIERHFTDVPMRRKTLKAIDKFRLDGKPPKYPSSKTARGAWE